MALKSKKFGKLDAFYRPWMRSICHIALPPRLQKIVAAFCFHESSELFEWLWRLLACCASPVVLDRFHQCGAVFWARILDRYMRMIEVFGSCLGGCLEARRSSCRPGSPLSFCGARSKFAWLLSVCWRFVAQVLYARVYFIIVLQCVFYRVRRGWLAPNGRRLVFAFSCWLFMCRVQA